MYPERIRYGVSGTLSGARSAPRFIGYLSTVPESDYPYLVFMNSIEESVRLDVDFAVGKLREFQHDRARLGKTREPLERSCHLLLKPPGGGSVVMPDRLDSREKLHSR